jgi:uncharacterized protein YceH (UPF0502 family)
MTVKHDMTTPKMTRVTVRVPKTTLDQINDWVDALGVRRSHFLGIALVAGVRSLIRASALEVAPSSEEARQQAAEGDSANTDDGELQKAEAEIAALKAEIAVLREQLAALQDRQERS